MAISHDGTGPDINTGLKVVSDQNKPTLTEIEPEKAKDWGDETYPYQLGLLVFLAVVLVGLFLFFRFY